MENMEVHTSKKFKNLDTVESLIQEIIGIHVAVQTGNLCRRNTLGRLWKKRKRSVARNKPFV